MPSTRETILAALTAQLAAHAGAEVRRNAVLPERVPYQGLVILRDGTPGEPDVTLSPWRAWYSHRVEVEAFMPPGASEAALDALLTRIGAALAHDDSLDGRVELMTPSAPELQPVPVEGGAPFLAATLAVTLEYQVTDPLGG
ncbi:acyl-CoA transferase [Roseovarius sp.]|uniref:acyl-CoA transferase n=1 Tax=Roseovarius sp. TaxID=1486281 RepID=UPI0035662A73